MRFVLVLLLLIGVGGSDASATGAFGSEYAADGRCGPFPRARVTTPPWLCLGIVAGPAHGLVWPRSIVQVEDNRFILTDMIAWDARGQGRVFSLSIGPDGKAAVSALYSDRNLPHGLVRGPDGKVYAGDDDRIWRFDPADPSSPPETLLAGLPDKLSRGGDHLHPLKHMIFDTHGDLIVNMGAPGDGCRSVEGSRVQWPYPCPYAEAPAPDAALWKLKFEWPAGKPGEFAPIARGLRNSVALAVHPKSGLLLQAENGIDLWNGRAEAEQPPDELNVILPGRHYGWPYCAGFSTLVPEYRRKLKDCGAYEPPYMLLPAHSAPLSMMYYGGRMFPELRGKLLIAFHGFREHGHRILAYDVDAEGKPLLTDGKEPAAMTTLVSGWSHLRGVRPTGSPLSLIEAKDGSVWFVDDRARTVMVLLRDSGRPSAPGEDRRTSQTREIAAPPGWPALYRSVLHPRCQTCHEEMRRNDPGQAWQDLAARGWADPQDPRNSPIVHRMLGEGPGTPMPKPAGLKSFPRDFARLQKFIGGLPPR
ncbi:MAG: PQQ-dependent sugar dehydrogenase [Rhodomicrobium sp.]